MPFLALYPDLKSLDLRLKPLSTQSAPIVAVHVCLLSGPPIHWTPRALLWAMVALWRRGDLLKAAAESSVETVPSPQQMALKVSGRHAFGHIVIRTTAFPIHGLNFF